VTSRLIRLGVGLLLSLAAMAGVLPSTGLSVVPSAAPAEARGMGQRPLDDILYWADQSKACGLTRDQLAAMMIAPTYPETGASGEQAPSPMTLSRWDTQSSLWAFGNKSTPYQRAFWHPGVGMWQFDSAGGWNLTAATAISTGTSAQQAAAVMVSRWCANRSRAYVWGPWYGCVSGNICETIYQQIYDGVRLRNITVDALVTRDGGMATRSCRFGSAIVTCHWVDPSRAQGAKGWASPSAGPTPITAPFYVLSVNGREMRVWLKQDTGYGVNVSADKPITANARTSLVWSTTTKLCDLSANRGDCAEGPRVASAPWGFHSELPFGSLDNAKPANTSISVTGWAIDPDTSSPIDVHVYVDGVWTRAVRADRPRPDVAAAIPGYGELHGYETNLPGLRGGPHEVCVYAINVGPHGDINPRIGCRTVQVVGNPFGNIDAFRMGPGGVFVEGWAIDPDTSGPIGVHAYVDGKWGGLGTTDRTRSDVLAAYPWWGSSRGYRVLVPLTAGRHTVCVYGINVGWGTHNPQLACRTAELPDGTPRGSFDGMARVAGGVRVTGWSIDPSTANPVQMHVYVNGRWGGQFTANAHRPDVGAAYPGFGDNHGFDATLNVGSAAATVCIYAINVGPGATNPLVGCRTG
jgi:hypothetical protein